MTNFAFRRVVVFLGLSCGLVAACGSGGGKPVSFSAPVGINVKAKADDVKNGVVAEEKNVNTETGNPYGAFVAQARQNLNGMNPSHIELDSATLLLGGSSKGVLGLEEVMTGAVTVLFQMNDTNNSFPAAHVQDPKGPGPVPLAIDFAGAGVTATDFTKLVGGNFRVAIRGTAAPTFNGGKKGAEADLQVTLNFVAYE